MLLIKGNNDNSNNTTTIKTAIIINNILIHGTCNMCIYRHQNNGQSTDMTNQTLPFVCPEFSAVTEMTGHFFLNNWKRLC